MLEIRPVCEHCSKALPNDSPDAMICSFECTFCRDCAENILFNVCPNCGGGFEKRPTRPVRCITVNCVENFPVQTEKKIRPVDPEKFKSVLSAFRHMDPRSR